jgi:hypothetical protein
MRRKTPLNKPKRGVDRPLTLVPGGKAVDPTPVRRFELSSLRGIRRELSSVYRLARVGELELQSATRLAYLLSTLGKLSESELLEDRLRRLELTMEDRDSGNKH